MYLILYTLWTARARTPNSPHEGEKFYCPSVLQAALVYVYMGVRRQNSDYNGVQSFLQTLGGIFTLFPFLIVHIHILHIQK